MTLVLQIVVLLLVLVGLITTIMSIKNWHWAQMLLLLGIFFASIAVLVLGLEVFRINRNIRKGIPALETRIATEETRREALERGTRDSGVIGSVLPDPAPFDVSKEGGRMPGLGVWTRRLQDLARQRGRVWNNVHPTARVNPQGRIPVAIPEPKPHGLENGAVVYAFEAGEPNAATPDQGPQFLGEFRVLEAAENGVVLEAVQRLDLDPRATARLARSSANPQSAWKLYETMPADSHDLFAGLSEEQLRKMLPAASVQEYIRHGAKATDDDDEYHRAGYDESGNRVGPENADKATEWRYDRPLRDYSYLFSELLRERVVMLAERAGLQEDNAKLQAALTIAKQLTDHRTKEKQALTKDLQFMQRDRQVVEKLRDTIKQMLTSLEQRVAESMKTNAQLAQDLVNQQLARLRQIDQAAPAAPATSELLGAP